METEVVRNRVLVADDDAADRNYVTSKLTSLGFEVHEASDGFEALHSAPQFQPHVILSDIRMPRVDGYELIRKLRSGKDETPVILLTQFGTMDDAVSAIHTAGAFWFLEKPVQMQPLQALIARALEQADLWQENERLKQVLRSQAVGDFVAEDAKMKVLLGMVQKIAATKTNVLVTGESGTGKEVVARAIHDLSPRKLGPFVALNCAAIPESLVESELFGHEKGSFTGAYDRQLGKIELAHEGTLFLDEIGELPLHIQPKLLRVLEDSRVRRLGGKAETAVDIRIVAATNRNLPKAIADGLFREDLFYRLAVFELFIPPLRERLDDIPALALTLLAKLDKKYDIQSGRVSPDVLQALRFYPWPGNVRELRNVLERAHVLANGRDIQLDHLPPNLAQFVDRKHVPEPISFDREGFQVRLPATLEEVERALIYATLKHTGDDRRQAAELIGLSLKTVQNKLKTWKVEALAGDGLAEM